MPKSFHIVCLEPGSDNPIQNEPVPDSEPPEGFVDNVVYRYKLDENGNKVLIGTMPAFPENWNIPKEFKKGEGKMSKDKRNPGPKREDREEIMAKVRGLVAEGKAIAEAARILGVPVSTIYTWQYLERKQAQKAQKQAQEPVPVQVGSQEPERENQEPAEPSVTPEALEVSEKVTPPKNDGFGLEDNKPIPYVPLEDLIAELRDDLDLERKKVANLEKKMDLLTSALSAVASVKATSSETRLARLLVAVFREMETGIGAKE
jgi:hypothetical protein